ncbi:MAG TPA: ABC transporter permease subunit [Streptosporangiaceae bacterium]|jgi:ABC-2 type transport system permease protein
MSADSALTDGAISARGVIHDRGYRRYEGPRLGRVQIIRALLWHSFRSAFGIGRGAKAKILPVIAVVAICLPAIINAVAVANGGSQVVGYESYLFALRVIVLTVFVAVQAPEMVSRDLRSRVLPLYFSRPMRRGDYPLAKYLAFTAACVILVDLPLVLLYLGTIASSKSGGIWPNTRGLLGGLAIGLMWAVLVSAIALALASLTGRRAYATGVVAIFFFLTFILSQIIQQIAGQGRGQFISPQTVPAGQRLAGLISPFNTLQGLTKWFSGVRVFHPGEGPVPDPGSYAPAYIVMFVVLLAASFAILAVRYRKAGVA